MTDNNTSTPCDDVDHSAVGRLSGDTTPQDEGAKFIGAGAPPPEPHRPLQRLRDTLAEVKAAEAADPSLERQDAAAVAAQAEFGSKDAQAALAATEAGDAKAEAERLAEIEEVNAKVKNAFGIDCTAMVSPGAAGQKGPRPRRVDEWVGEVSRQVPHTTEGRKLGDKILAVLLEAAFPGYGTPTERKRYAEKAAKKYDEETRAAPASGNNVDEEAIEYEPDENPLPLADIADQALDSFRQWVSASEEALVIDVLWGIGTWGLLPGCTKRQFLARGGVVFHPYLRVSSVGENSGKSTMLTALGSLVRAPYEINRITPSALFRDFAARQRVGLADEIGDTLRQYPEINQLLEVMCYRHGVVKLTEEVARNGRKTRATVRFHVHGGLVLCGVERRGGIMRSTVQNRAIHLHMTPAAARGPFKPLPLEVLLKETADAADRWGPSLAAHADTIRAAMVQGPRSALPAFLHNRRRDVWVHLFAVADLLGDEWPMRCLAACRLIEQAAKGGGVSDAQDLLDAMRVCQEERKANYAAVEHALKAGSEPPAGPPVSALKGQHPYGTPGSWYDPNVPLAVLPVLHFCDWLTTNSAAIYAAATEGRNGGPLSAKKIDIILGSTVKTKRRQDLPDKPTCYEISDLEKLWLAADAAETPDEGLSDPFAGA